MTTRFIFPGQYAMRPMKKGKGSLLAYFDVVDTVTGLIYRDCRLIDGPKGVFAAPPSREYEKDGETKYVKYWSPAYDIDTKAFDEKGMAWMDELTEAAYAAYQQKDGSEEKPAKQQTSRAQTSRQSSTGRSARGPINPPRVQPPDNEIPF